MDHNDWPIVGMAHNDYDSYECIDSSNIFGSLSSHQGSLRYNGRHNCGISLISPTKGVTAAHCVDGYKM